MWGHGPDTLACKAIRWMWDFSECVIVIVIVMHFQSGLPVVSTCYVCITSTRRPRPKLMVHCVVAVARLLEDLSGHVECHVERVSGAVKRRG